MTDLRYRVTRGAKICGGFQLEEATIDQMQAAMGKDPDIGATSDVLHDEDLPDSGLCQVSTATTSTFSTVQQNQLTTAQAHPFSSTPTPSPSPRRGTPNDEPARVIPESEHMDSVGTFGRTVRDAVYALSMPSTEKMLEITTHLPKRQDAGGRRRYLATSSSLRGATFGLPWHSFWVHADEGRQSVLKLVLSLIEAAGAAIVNGTEIADYERLRLGLRLRARARGFPNEREFTVVKTDFYNNIRAYLAELDNTNIKSLSSTRAGIDAALTQLTQMTPSPAAKSTTQQQRLSGLLVPPDVGQTYQIAVQAGYPMATIPVPAGVHAADGMPFGLGIMQTAWGEEEELVRWASAIEDLLLQLQVQPSMSSDDDGDGTASRRRLLPRWHGYLQRNVPVL
ncbi:amidase [Apiospora marii]|uniref:Amidase n=1 Tax=Apiospora marii TaxID=335849 RepID=A0ABR1RZF6_9PEZI